MMQYMLVSFVVLGLVGVQGMQVLKVNIGGQQEVRAFKRGVVATDTEVEGQPGRLREVSNAEKLIRMIYTEGGELVDCQVATQLIHVQAFLEHALGLEGGSASKADPPVEKQDISVKEIAERVQFGAGPKSKVQVHNVKEDEELQHFTQMLDMGTHTRTCAQLQANHYQNNIQHQQPHHRSRRSFFIFPGTNWCGTGNEASELGESLDTDKCCREHDNCPYYIESMREKYNHFNFKLYTISHCACDEQFRTCLRMANTESAGNVGNVYFNWIRMGCFIFRPTRVCAERTWYGRCIRYENDYEAEVRDPLTY